MKNYNIFALSGDMETTDYDVCDTLGIDPKYAGTPQINDQAINLMHRKNYDGYVARGMEPGAALRQADKLANDTRQRIKTLMS